MSEPARVEAPSASIRLAEVALLASVFVVAACGLVYELAAGTLASYLLGDSILQFSTVIGAYLFAMGVGSWLSRWFERQLVAHFLRIELLVGLIGGLMPVALFALQGAGTASFRFALYALVLAVGILVGLEIPLLMRILRERFDFKDVVAHVLTFDYLGALGASLLFPLVLVPHLGLVRAALLFGLINAAVAFWTTILLKDLLGARRYLQVLCVAVVLALGAGWAMADRTLALGETTLYADDVILARNTPYQRIVLTAWKDDLRLFLNSHLQFSSRDEYRYHEALVHPGLAAMPQARKVLVLGGGDGLALREVLRYSHVEHVTLVDLDPAMTQLFSTHPELVRLNGGALSDPRVRVVNADAFVWLEQHHETFDFAVVDFPDPSNFSIGKLYTTAFYRELATHLGPEGRFVVQSTSPLFARQSFWCIVATLEQSGLTTSPYHLYVPSFGEWGFVLAGRQDYVPPSWVPGGLRYLSASAVPELFEFPLDMRRVPVEPNHLNTQALVRYYEQEWDTINR